MKVLVCSDLQLGAGAAYGTPEQPRLRDQAEALERIAEYAQQADLALFLGDAFEHREPGVDELLVYHHWLGAMPEVLMQVGNHDVRGPGLPSALDLFGSPYTRPDYEVRQLPGERAVAFAFLPWAHPGPLRAARGPAQPQEQAEALVRAAADLYAQVQAAVPGAYAVLCTHHALSGMSIPSGISTAELVGEPVLDSHALLEQGWHQILAGHVHRADSVHAADGRSALMVGSPYACDFGEAGLPHGVWLMDTEASAMQWLEVPGRPFVTLEWQGLDGYDSWRTSAVYDSRVVGAVVRLRWRLTEAEAEHVDAGEVRRGLYAHRAHKVYSVQLDVERATRARAEGLREDTEPLEALNAWASAAQVGVRETERLRALTQGYLEEAVPV